jgi:para-aminobenzoate synthetase component 1
LPTGIPFRAEALRQEEAFLFRRVADQGRAVLGVGVLQDGERPRFDAQGRSTDWFMGHLAYGYKDRLEPLGSRLHDAFGWPLSHWFIPRWVYEWQGDDLTLYAYPDDAAAGIGLAHAMAGPPAAGAARVPIDWRPAMSRAEYLHAAGALMAAIQRGDIYEVNLCTAHEAVVPGFDPFAAFDRLLADTDAPFAGFLRMGTGFALCASPERFLAMNDRRMAGEPMKGTRPRGRSAAEDQRLARELALDAKERSENVMAVDVMRNDLARVSVPGSVRVTELCGVRSYPRVHQLVSAMEAERRTDVDPFTAVEAAFPMASMTGAPKFRAMQLIDAAEARARGLYSGTMGFFAPDGTADLNVVIRTVLFDQVSSRLSIPTGSALTAQCDPSAEWDECLVKLNSIAHALTAP